MSLQLQISAVEEGNSIIVYDCTGNYSHSNTGGYGGLNPKRDDVVEMYFDIKTPTWKEGQDPIRINVYPDLPNKEEFGYEILPSFLQMGDEIESGQYIIKATLVTEDKNGSKTTKTAVMVLFCVKSITCCVDKKVKDVRAGQFNDPKQQLIIELSNLLESLNYQVKCGNYGIANKDLEYLKSHCKCCGCS